MVRSLFQSVCPVRILDTTRVYQVLLLVIPRGRLLLLISILSSLSIENARHLAMDDVLTTNHAVDHGDKWTFQGKSFAEICLLCLIEKLKSEQLQLSVFVRSIFCELTELFQRRDVQLTRISEDTNVLMRLCSETVGNFII